jgi:hypothetical protein
MKDIFIRPGITAEGYKTSLRDYNDASPIEELAANSYDADAKTFLLAADFKNSEIHIFDDGTGFEDNSFEKLLTLGQGTKSSLDHARSDRPYLGNYGFGFKSTVNIAKEFEIVTFNKGNKYSTNIDWEKLPKTLEEKDGGFSVKLEKAKQSIHGTYIKLRLKTPITKADLEKYKRFLGNLPQDDGDFSIYLGTFSDVRNLIPKDVGLALKNLKKIAKRAERKERIEKINPGEGSDLNKCIKKEYKSQKDARVRGVCYFMGFDKNKKVIPLKRGLRGIYIRVNGRLIKKDFSVRKFTQPIHRWVSFESGLRIEISINWIADQLSLSRGDILFRNEKIEEEFKSNLTNIITQSIKPLIRELEKRSLKRERTFHGQRINQADKRIKKHKDVVIKSIKGGFNFRPESDAELALIFSQPNVIARALPNHRLIDYNASASFDCLLWDERNRRLVHCELEPRLDVYLTHKRPEEVHLVICWTRGNWKVGSKKKGKKGALELVSEQSGKGRYQMLEYPSLKSKKPKRNVAAIVLEDIIE